MQSSYTTVQVLVHHIVWLSKLPQSMHQVMTYIAGTK